MVLFTLAYACGVWWLQQQAALPGYGWAGWLALAPLAIVLDPQRIWARVLRGLLTVVCAALLGFYLSAYQAQQRLAVSLPDEWQGRDISVIGVVAELPRVSERGQRFVFDVEQTLTAGVSVPHRLYLSTYVDERSEPLQVHAGERWRYTVRLKQPHGSSDPNGFDFERWALENDIRATGYVLTKADPQRLAAPASGFGYLIERGREAVRERFLATLRDAPYAGVLSALAIGDQGSIPQAQWQVYTRTGVNHLMSISGLHITMLASLAYALCYWSWRRSVRLTLWLPARKAASAVALLMALAYALLSGYGVPAQRTVYMVAAVTVALWLRRNFSVSQILSLALLAVLLHDPWAVLAPGFWLSFGAVALILYVSTHRLVRLHAQTDLPASAGRWAYLKHVIREYAVVQWAMSIGLTPLLLGLFQQVSLVSPLANALAIPLVSLIVVPLTLLGAVLPIDGLLWLAHAVMQFTHHFLAWLDSFPVAVWTQHAPPAWSVVSGMAGALLILAPRGFPSRWLGWVLLLPMFLNTPATPAPGTLRMIVFDVGQGLAVGIQTHGHALLYDTGPDYAGDADSGNRVIVPALRAMGISRLDGLILSHDDIDHSGGTTSVLQALPVTWVASSLPDDSPMLRDVPVQQDAAGQGKRRCADGEHWNWDGVDFAILHPAPGSQNDSKPRDNDLSCVLRVSLGGQHLLLTGDIEKRSELRLLQLHAEQLPANLLVVPHHGSKSSSTPEFIAAVLPDYAVLTNGYRNRYGHPHAEIVQRYADSGAELLRSDRDGALLVEMDAQGLQVERYRQTHRRYWTHQVQAP